MRRPSASGKRKDVAEFDARLLIDMERCSEALIFCLCPFDSDAS